MTTAILGGVGFVGRHLIRRLVELDDVICVDNFSRCIVSSRWAGPYEQTKIITLDVSEAGVLAKVFEDNDVDTVYNLAASVAGIYHNLDHQFSMYADNWGCAKGPLIAASHAGVKNFLQVSSVCVYSPVMQERWAREGGVPEQAEFYDAPQEANAGYAEAKRDAERMANWLSDNFDQMVIVRPSNIIGPGDHFDEKAHVVPALIRRVIHETSPLVVYGNPNYIREFVDVRDVARAMVTLMTGGYRGTFNIGSGQLITIEQLGYNIAHVHHKAGNELRDVSFPRSEGGDKFRLSNSSLLRSTGWEPQFTIQESIQDCYDVYTS